MQELSFKAIMSSCTDKGGDIVFTSAMRAVLEYTAGSCTMVYIMYTVYMVYIMLQYAWYT